MRDGYHYQFWVYILTSRTGTLYIGITGYLGTRIMQHKIDSIGRIHQKIQSPSTCLLRKLPIHPDRNSTRKTAQRLAAGKENCVGRKDESTVARFGGKLGMRNAVSGTVHSENSLNQHGKGYILGMFRRALTLPLRGLRSALLNMTMWKIISANGRKRVRVESA
jgi:hypothetical protein